MYSYAIYAIPNSMMENIKYTKKPLIGITSRYINMRTSDALGSRKLCLNNDYLDSIFLAGGIPLILPISQDEATIQSYANTVDGLILSGGEDIDPKHYGEEPGQHLGTVAQDRDHFEIGLVKAILDQKKPLLGICRGLQVLNVSLGGSLHQDIPSEFPGTSILHRQKSEEHAGSHRVDLLKGSKIHGIFATDSLMCNSFHHQSIKTLAPGLLSTALSSDGIIEGVEMPEANFVVAVQWHPECMVRNDPTMLKLFKSFIQAASREEC